MNASSTVLHAALGITLLAVVGLVTTFWAARRSHSAASKAIAWTLAMTIVLTALAWTPWPRPVRDAFWPDTAPERGTVSNSAQAYLLISAVDVTQDAGSVSGSLLELLSSARSAALTFGNMAPATGSPWANRLALLLAAGAVIGLARIVLGLWAVRELSRRSDPVWEPNLNRLVGELQAAMGYRASIELRKSAQLRTAATVGWRRPVILLPATWRQWSLSERRAVLAHEIAHIQRRDFASGVVAQLCVALHFYHPLVHWLARRLRLQQELAADARAAALAGGNETYLRALARLALGNQDQSIGWPARAFLPAHGTLMRRIDMLQRECQMRSKRSERWIAAVSTLLVVGAGSAIAWIGGPGTHRRAGAAQEAPASKQSSAFDLSYVSPGAMGVIAFRPAEAFASGSLKPYAAIADMFIAQSMKAVGVAGAPAVSVMDIEQVVGAHRFLHNPDAPKGSRRSIIMDPCMIRMVKPFDWKQAAKAMGAELEEVPCAGGSFYRASKMILPPILAPQTITFYMPDDRTLVLNTEENLRKIIADKSNALPESVWPDGWKHVARDLFAVAVDARGADIAAALDAEQIEDETDQILIDLLIKKAKRTTFGVSIGQGIRLRAFGACDDETTAEEAEAATANLKNLAARSLSSAKAENDAARAMLATYRELLESVRVHRTGVQLDWTAESKQSLADLLVNSVKAEISAGK